MNSSTLLVHVRAMHAVCCNRELHCNAVAVLSADQYKLSYSAYKLCLSLLLPVADATMPITSRQQTVRCNVYQYHELQAATANFSDSNIIGEGGFGRVYKGRLSNGAVVAVKRLDRHGLQVCLPLCTATA